MATRGDRTTPRIRTKDSACTLSSIGSGLPSGPCSSSFGRLGRCCMNRDQVGSTTLFGGRLTLRLAGTSPSRALPSGSTPDTRSALRATERPDRGHAVHRRARACTDRSRSRLGPAGGSRTRDAMSADQPRRFVRELRSADTRRRTSSAPAPLVGGTGSRSLRRSWRPCRRPRTRDAYRTPSRGEPLDRNIELAEQIGDPCTNATAVSHAGLAAAEDAGRASPSAAREPDRDAVQPRRARCEREPSSRLRARCVAVTNL